MSRYGDYRARRGTALPPYKADTSCPKCWHDVISTAYDKGGCSDKNCRSCDQEHLYRTCQRCHYGWPEAVQA